jgi:RNA 2',3'-cyclic 3'-phosphodiesterase
MPRLFTAIELPPDIRLRLSLIRGDLQNAHWIEPGNMHITMRFAGDITDREATDFAQALDDARVDPFTLKISGTGSFGGRKPTALYATIEPSDALNHLQRLHERAARAAGLPAEPRPFKPHITLARLRNTRAPRVAQFLEQHGDLRLGPMTVERFVLLSARPGVGGGPYAIEEIYDLNDLTIDDHS